MDNLQTKIDVLETKIQEKQAWIDQKILEIREESGIDALEKELRALRAEIKQDAQNDAKAEAEQLLADATAENFGKGELYLYKAPFLGLNKLEFVRLAPMPGGDGHLEMHLKSLNESYNRCVVLSKEFINHQDRMGHQSYGSKKRLVMMESTITEEEKNLFLKALIEEKNICLKRALYVACENDINPFHTGQKAHVTGADGELWDAVCTSGVKDAVRFAIFDENGDLLGIINSAEQLESDVLTDEDNYEKATPERLMWLEIQVGEFDHYFED